MVVELMILKKKMTEEQVRPSHKDIHRFLNIQRLQGFTSFDGDIQLHQRYNFAASSTMKKNLVDQMNKFSDNFYETHWKESDRKYSPRRMKGKEITIPAEMIPKEMLDFIITMGKGYLCNSGLRFMNINPATINLEIERIWVRDSEETDYISTHSHVGLLSGTFYLKVPPQVFSVNEEGSLNFHLSEDGFLDLNPLQSIRPKDHFMELPEEGKFIIFPAWLKHSVTPFHGPGIRRAVSFNLICPHADEWKLVPLHNKRIGEENG